MKPEEIRKMSSQILAGSKYKEEQPEATTNNQDPAPVNTDEVEADEVDKGDYDSSVEPTDDGFTITLKRKQT